MSGPPRKPTAVKAIQGNPGRKPLPKDEPVYHVKTTPPAWLSDRARREWARLRPHLERLGLLTVADRAAFAVYCDAYATMVELTEDIREHGRTTLSENGVEIPRPAVWMRKQAVAEMRAFLLEFGLTPASRSKVQAKVAEKKSAAEFLFGGTGTPNGGKRCDRGDGVN